MDIDLLLELQKDYKERLATPIYVGIRKGYLQNENDVNEKLKDGFTVGTPVSIVNEFIQNYLKNE